MFSNGWSSGSDGTRPTRCPQRPPPPTAAASAATDGPPSAPTPAATSPCAGSAPCSSSRSVHFLKKNNSKIEKKNFFICLKLFFSLADFEILKNIFVSTKMRQKIQNRAEYF